MNYDIALLKMVGTFQFGKHLQCTLNNLHHNLCSILYLHRSHYVSWDQFFWIIYWKQGLVWNVPILKFLPYGSGCRVVLSQEKEADPWRCQADLPRSLRGLGAHLDANRCNCASFSINQVLPWSFFQASLWGLCVFQSQENNLMLDISVQLQAGVACLKVRTSVPLLLIRILKTFWWTTRNQNFEFIILNNQSNISNV